MARLFLSKRWCFLPQSDKHSRSYTETFRVDFLIACMRPPGVANKNFEVHLGNVVVEGTGVGPGAILATRPGYQGLTVGSRSNRPTVKSARDRDLPTIEWAWARMMMPTAQPRTVWPRRIRAGRNAGELKPQT